ncbi:MAG: hypothetical protein K6B46_01385, partial [Opitutales bacterium]|nr:hypothetical protein [Opitutales bacterium]
MKFSKTLFFAAASLFAGTAISATAAVTAVTINTGDTISAKERIDGGFWSSRDIRLSGTGGTLSVDTDYLYVRENITGYGQLIDLIPGTEITWAELLVGDRLNRWTGPWANASSYYQGAIVTTLGGALAISAGIPAWSSGEIVINEGKSLSVKSQINTWLGYGTLNNTLGLTSRMAGASVTMKAGSSLNFADYDASSNPAPGSNSLIQYLYNVKSDGDSATTTLMTRSGAGSQSFYVNIHIDDAVNGGSLGKIVGS